MGIEGLCRSSSVVVSRRRELKEVICEICNVRLVMNNGILCSGCSERHMTLSKPITQVTGEMYARSSPNEQALFTLYGKTTRSEYRLLMNLGCSFEGVDLTI